MLKANIAYFNPFNQDTMEGVSIMKKTSFHNLLKYIAHEYGNYVNQEYVVNLRTLDISDQRLILSHILDSEEYEDACRSHVATEAYFKEHLAYIEEKMCDAEYEAYLEIMEEAERHRSFHKDNNETYFK